MRIAARAASLAVAVAILVPVGSALGRGEIVGTSLVGSWDGFSGSYADVWGDGDHAYLGQFGTPAVEIVDISDPTNPTLAAQYALPPPSDTGSAQDVKVADGILYIGVEGEGASAHLVDVRDPANPVGLVDVELDGFGHTHNLFIHEGYLYIVDSNTPQVGIVDLTDLDPDDPPASPITTTKWVVADVGTDKVHDVTVVGDRMYASAWDSGVWIYDITNIETEAPIHLGNGPGDNTHSCWPTADGRYVITGEERGGGGITCYRIVEGDGASVSLEITDAVALDPGLASSVHNQVTIGNRVYNSWYGAGLRVYDVDPASGLLEFVASYDTPTIGSMWGVYPLLGPDRILLSDIGEGLFIVALDGTPGDIDGDGAVTFQDLLALLGAWGPCPAPPASCPADLDGDGIVGFSDLLSLLAHWG
jgi:hypothetical protein